MVGEKWKCFDMGPGEIKETPKVHSMDQRQNPIKKKEYLI